MYILTFNLEIEDNGYVLSNVVSTMVFGSQILAHLVTLLESSIKQASQVRFFLRIREFDNLIRYKLLHKVNFQDITKKLLPKYILAGVVIILCYLVNMYTVAKHLHFYSHLASVATLRIRFIQEEVYLELLNARFNVLQMKLKQMVNCKQSKKNKFLDVNYEVLHHPLRIMTLKEGFTKLHEALEYFNDSFGCSLLFSISSYFLDFTCNSYWLLLAMDDKRPDYMIGDYSTTLIQICLQLSMLCRTGHICIENLIEENKLTEQQQHKQQSLNWGPI
ncbi:putative gustatory receptor 39b [Episyrphus balteatus]|uniref:putative gustatory receptor 39b n=1 Tax=Episyrphus balteatus TaxID=286459 RepID=UPI00248549E6|nr:putative gustatory receptor 39b [Episyrphus balteatus]